MINSTMVAIVIELSDFTIPKTAQFPCRSNKKIESSSSNFITQIKEELTVLLLNYHINP